MWRHQREIRELSAQLRQKAELQVRAELVETATGTRLGGNTFTLSSTQRAGLQTVARDIAAELLPRLREK